MCQALGRLKMKKRYFLPLEGPTHWRWLSAEASAMRCAGPGVVGSMEEPHLTQPVAGEELWEGEDPRINF